jgi:hypothetical protein
LGAGGASEAFTSAAASGEWSASEEARLRSGSGDEEEEEDETGPGRRRVSVRAVSSKSSPEAAEDSVELRPVSTDMAGGARVGRSAMRARLVSCRFRFSSRRGGVGRESCARFGYSGGVVRSVVSQPSRVGPSSYDYFAPYAKEYSS